MIEWLRFTLPGFVYSVSLAPPLVAAVRAALQILKDEPDRLRRLHQTSRYFVEAARMRGLNTGTAMIEAAGNWRYSHRTVCFKVCVYDIV